MQSRDILLNDSKKCLRKWLQISHKLVCRRRQNFNAPEVVRIDVCTMFMVTCANEIEIDE